MNNTLLAPILGSTILTSLSGAEVLLAMLMIAIIFGGTISIIGYAARGVSNVMRGRGLRFSPVT